jgi:Cys-tRNA(Pro) deacylase
MMADGATVLAMPDTPAIRAAAASGLSHRVVEFGRVRDIHEAARRRGIDVAQIVKTLVVRRGEEDYLLVLVPGDRVIDWPALRSHLGVSRLSMPDADDARRVTGYERGTITPLGCARDLPIVADPAVARLREASIGGGAHGVAIHLDGADLVAFLGAEVAAVTAPA